MNEINLKKLLSEKKYNDIIEHFNKNKSFNNLNIFTLTKEEVIEIFNNIILKEFQNDIKNKKLEVSEIIYKYKNIIENIYQIFHLMLEEKNNEIYISKIKFEEMEIAFVEFIINSLKNMETSKFNSKEKFYMELKQINLLVNIYLANSYKFINNINCKVANLIISNKLKNIYINSFIDYININKNIVDKNKILIENLYYKHDGFKHLLPFYFYNSLFTLIYNYEFNINDINIKLKDNILNFVETFDKNPFYSINLLSDKIISTITSYFLIYNEYINMNILNKNKNLIYFDNKNLTKILRLHYENIFYSLKELIGNKNIISNLKENYQNYSYITLLHCKVIVNNLKETVNFKNFDKFIFYNMLNEYLKYNYGISSNNNISSVNYPILELIDEENTFIDKLPFNFYFTIKFMYSILENNYHLDKNKIIGIPDLKEFEETLLKYTKNIVRYSEETYKTQNFFNYETLNLYIFLKIGYYKEKFETILNELIYAIKFYKIKTINYLIKELEKNFLLNKSMILYFILNRKLISTEEIIETFDLENIKKLLKNNEILIIELLLNIKNKNIKENKMLINHIIELQKEINSPYINLALRNLGLRFQSPFVIIPDKN